MKPHFIGFPYCLSLLCQVLVSCGGMNDSSPSSDRQRQTKSSEFLLIVVERTRTGRLKFQREESTHKKTFRLAQRAARTPRTVVEKLTNFSSLTIALKVFGIPFALMIRFLCYFCVGVMSLLMIVRNTSPRVVMVFGPIYIRPLLVLYNTTHYDSISLFPLTSFQY